MKNVTYEGAPTLGYVVEGIVAAPRNCRRLAADMATLLAAGSWPMAASMAILAVEEAGNVDVLALGPCGEMPALVHRLLSAPRPAPARLAERLLLRDWDELCYRPLAMARGEQVPKGGV